MVVGVVVLAFGGCSALMSMTSNVAKENAGDGHTAGTGSQPTDGAIGSTVSDGKFSFRVTDVSSPGANFYGRGHRASG